MSAVLTPTRRPRLGRLRARLRAAYLRYLIKHAEKDLDRQRAEFDHISQHAPRQMKHTQAYIDSLGKLLHRATHEF
jgi:hypothetical protein